MSVCYISVILALHLNVKLNKQWKKLDCLETEHDVVMLIEAKSRCDVIHVSVCKTLLLVTLH